MEYKISGDTLTAIADSIRAKTGGTESYKPSEMAAAILDLGTNVVNIPTYYMDHLTGKISDIKTELAKHSDPVCFFLFTDYHNLYKDQSEGNAHGTGDLIRYTGSKVGCNDAVFCGDLLSYENTEALMNSSIEAFLDEISGMNRLMIVKGNHDLNPYGSPNMTDEGYISRVMSVMDGNYGISITDKTYYFRDDTKRKVRYIVLDSRETSIDYSYSSGDDAEKAFATAEMQWFGETLQSTPEGYTVIVFSHVMWWGTSDQTSVQYSASNMQPVQMMYAYNTRSTYSGCGVTFDFSGGVAEAKVMLTGHTHKDFSQVFLSNVLVLSTSADSWAFANARPDYVTHTKGTYTEHVIDFMIIDPGAKTIDTIRIGAGSDRHFEFGTNLGQKCSVTNLLENCTNSNSEEVAYGSYSATINANTGYTLNDVSVLMNGVNMSKYVTVAEDKKTAEINLPVLPTNALEISASAVNEATYTVTNDLTNCTNSNSAATAAEGSGYSAVITPNTGYNISSIVVTMGGTDVSASVVSENNISITNVTGEIVITAVATAQIYSVTNNLTNTVNSNNAATASYGSSYAATISAVSGYAVSSISVTMGGVDISASAVSGNNISIANVTGEIVITALASAVGYTNILNTVGYYNDMYLSAGYGMKTSTTGDVTTGYITVDDVSEKTVYIKGYSGAAGASHTRLRLQATNENTEYVSEINGFLGAAQSWYTVKSIGTGYYSVTFGKLKNYFSTGEYMRMCFTATKGENLIITIDEPIE